MSHPDATPGAELVATAPAPGVARYTQRGLSEPDRFWQHVKGAGPAYCWLWTSVCGEKGYGRFRLTGGPYVQAHRFSYELMIGPIPEGLELDHLCRNRACVNPWHLDPVPHAVNAARALGRRPGYCVSGHRLSPENVVTTNKSHAGRCLTCYQAQRAAYRARQKAAA